MKQSTYCKLHCVLGTFMYYGHAHKVRRDWCCFPYFRNEETEDWDLKNEKKEYVTQSFFYLTIK